MSETAFSSLLDEVGWPTGYGAAMGGDVRVFDLDVMLHDDDDMGIRILWKP